MIEEHRKVYSVSLVIVLAMAAFALPFDLPISLGLVLGIALYPVYLLVLTRSVTAQLEAAAEARSGAALPLAFILRMLVLAAPLLIAAKLPQHFNILAAFMPLFVNHVVTFILYGRKEAAA